jgi:uncharacterized protein
MSSLKSMADEFLTQKRIAVAGVSRTKEDAANLIYKKLRTKGYQVFAINPNAEAFDGDPCYPNVKSTPTKPDAVVIVTRPEITEQIVRDCVEAGIRYIWIHRSNINVLAGGCPMMFCEPVDVGHKCMRWLTRISGGLPK